MFFLQIIATIAVLTTLAMCAYHLLLAAVALFTPSQRSIDGRDTTQRFAILIPAFNEEAGIKTTLQSCRSLDYPQEKFGIYVIVDNCTDKTEQIASDFGVRCLVRQDSDKRGKGHALAWAIPQVLAEGWDGIIILDADCLLDSASLRVFSSHFVAGHRVLQANNSVSNPDDSPISYLLAVANKLENELSDAAKSQLGLACSLRGTGFALRRDVLQEIPWQSSSVVEDSEYSYLLLKAGIPVRFISDVHVVSQSPSNRGQLMVQRMRWIAGIRDALPRGFALLWEGLRDRQLLLFDAGVSAFVAGRFLVIFAWVIAFILAFSCWFFAPSTFNTWLLSLTIASGLLYLLYACIGVILVGLNRNRLKLLMHAPIVVLQYLGMAFESIVRARTAKWNRTPRT